MEESDQKKKDEKVQMKEFLRQKFPVVKMNYRPQKIRFTQHKG